MVKEKGCIPTPTGEKKLVYLIKTKLFSLTHLKQPCRSLTSGKLETPRTLWGKKLQGERSTLVFHKGGPLHKTEKHRMLDGNSGFHNEDSKVGSCNREFWMKTRNNYATKEKKV